MRSAECLGGFCSDMALCERFLSHTWARDRRDPMFRNSAEFAGFKAVELNNFLEDVAAEKQACSRESGAFSRLDEMLMKVPTEPLVLWIDKVCGGIRLHPSAYFTCAQLPFDILYHSEELLWAQADNNTETAMKPIVLPYNYVFLKTCRCRSLDSCSTPRKPKKVVPAIREEEGNTPIRCCRLVKELEASQETPS